MKKLIPLMIAAAAALGVNACTNHHHGSETVSALGAASNALPPAAVHGMVLFGDGPLYASHIPMFHTPHDWQALFEVTLSHPSVDAQALYLAQLAGGLQPLVTLEPKPFVLPLLFNGKLKSFEASLYLGNFEGDHQLLAEGVTVEVREVLMAQHLSRSTAPLPALTYLLLTAGNGNAYLAHKIAAPASFDHLLQVKVSGAPLAPGEQLLPVTFPGLPEAEASRLKAGQVLSLSRTAKGWNATVDAPAAPGAQVLTIVSDYYCTPGPDFSGDCQP